MITSPRERSTTLLSAALRHIRDAEHLAQTDPPSPEQTEHLAGFAPECARKALLHLDAFPSKVEDAFGRALSHDFKEFADQVVDLIIALQPRLRHSNARGWSQRHPELIPWNPECRYHATGYAKRVKGNLPRPVWRAQLLGKARVLTEEAAIELWLDGRLGVEKLG